ncbi:Protein of unknown function [Pyronema omphalodes CBS 100304]|uniref:Uncharacterized protein n=1 Tax=Pyronema omphalodes (strain CBS 100304) TaxID=1076935 RepID=U4LM42_PYROM|nr:Protein of unknown function [Pyronema omphalodes CBS 100304]
MIQYFLRKSIDLETHSTVSRVLSIYYTQIFTHRLPGIKLPHLPFDITLGICF